MSIEMICYQNLNDLHNINDKDKYLIDNLLQKCFPQIFQTETFMNQLKRLHKTEIFNKSDIWSILVKKDNAPIGFGQLKKGNTGNYKITNLCRHPELSQRGLGKKILDFLEWIAINKLKQRIVYLEANCHKLYAHYESCGYRPNQKPYMRDNNYQLYKYI